MEIFRGSQRGVMALGVMAPGWGVMAPGWGVMAPGVMAQEWR